MQQSQIKSRAEEAEGWRKRLLSEGRCAAGLQRVSGVSAAEVVGCDRPPERQEDPDRQHACGVPHDEYCAA